MAKKVGKRKQKSARKAKAEQEYLARGGTGAEDAVLAAGYSPSYARSRAHAVLADINFEIQQAMRSLKYGATEVARDTIALTTAKTVKWNSNQEEWDTFADNDVRLRAIQQAAQFLGFAAKREDTGDQRPIQIIFPANFGNLAVKVESGD
jgi:hypothetical protein